MLKRIRKPLTTKQTIFFVSIVKKSKRFLAVLGMLGMLWSNGPMQYLNAVSENNNNSNIVLSNEFLQDINGINNPVMSNNKNDYIYPSTTDEDFDPSQVDIEMEVISERTANTKTFRKLDGTYETAVYKDVIHYYEDGIYKQVDNSLIDKGDGFENNSNIFKVKFPKKLDDNKKIKLTLDRYQIDWSINEINSSNIKFDESKLTPNNIKELLNINQTILYDNVLKGVDIEYVISGSQIKENIILESYESNFSMTFEYKLKDLNLIKDTDGNIVFVNDSNEVVFYFNDFVMFDSNLNDSYNIEYDLKDIGNSNYEITIRPNDEWMKSAVYPVTIDPSITYYHYDGLIRDKYVYGTSGSVDNQYIKVGDNGSWKYRSYLEINMAIIPEDVQVTYAHLSMQTFSNYNYCTSDCTIIVKEVERQYSFDSIKGQGLNITDDRIIDYEIVNMEDSDSTKYYWDISRNFQQWAFDGDDTRILEFSRNDETKSGYIYFQSTNQNGIGPSVEVGFQYISGIKDFWTYNEQPVGPAGTGFVSDFTGQLNFVRQDISYKTDMQTLDLSFVYNTSFKQYDVGYGQGWLTNYNIQVQYDNDAEQFYTTDATGGKVWYIEYDENPYSSPNNTCDERFADMSDTYCYLAEDGSRNMLVVTYVDYGDGEEPGPIMLVTLEQVYYEFSSLGFLNKIRDEKHNTEITIDLDVILLDTNLYQARIEKVTDSTGNYIELSYISDVLDKAELFVKTSSASTYNLLKYTKYDFDTLSNPGENLLNQVRYNVDYNDDSIYEEEHKVNYEYDSANRLTLAETIYMDDQQQPVDAGKVIYTYTSDKVLTISNFYNGSKFGNVTYNYEYRKTTITNHLGDEVYYLFDVYGHTVQVMNDDGLLQSFKYLNIFSNTNYNFTYDPYFYFVRNYRMNHKLIYKSDPEISFLDPILNGSFEGNTSSDGWDFEIDSLGGATDIDHATHRYTTNEFVHGEKSAMLYYYDDSMESHLKQVLTVDPGTYKLQGYIKNDGANNNAYFRIEGASNGGGNSQGVPNDGDWHYVELTFGTTTTNQQITIKLMNAAHGSVYFDSMQIMEGFRNTRNNLFDNSSFESIFSGWNLYGGYKSDYNFSTESIYSKILGKSGLRIDGDPYTIKGAKTDITSIVGTTKGDIYTINLWGYSLGTPYKQHSDDGNDNTFDQESYMRAKISYTDAGDNVVSDPTYITFDQQIEGWQKLSTEIHIPENVMKVQLSLEYIGLGYVVYDGLTIEQALSGTSYLLNEAGNIEQITSSNSEVTMMNHEEDSNGNPVSSTPTNVNTIHNNTEIPLNDDFLPEYYENNNVRVTPTYDSYGRTTVEKYGDTSNYFTTSTTFDTGTFSQFKEKTTNEFGKSTNYDYDVITGLLQSIQNANGDFIEYEYYDDGLLHKVLNNGYCDNENPTECAYTEYVYDDSNRLIKVIMESGYYYYIDYDEAGRMQEVFIKNDNTSYSNSLMNYLYYQEGTNSEYETNKINIQTYGNGDFIKFIYDDNDRVKQVQYNNYYGTAVTRFSYEYDQRGQIAVFNTHNSSGTVINTEYYTYDISGKLLSVADNEGNRIEYEYDNEGNLNRLEFDILGKTQSVNYDHNEALHIDRDILDEQIFGNYDIQSGVISESDSDYEYDMGTTSVKINTVSSEPSFGGAIEVMPSSSYTVKMNVVSTTNSIRLQVAEYKDNPFETGNYYTTRYDTYSSATELRELTFTTGANTKYVIVSVYSGYTADFSFDSLTFDFDGLDDTSLYDQTTYITQDLQNVVRDYEYEDNALFRLDYINLQNGVFSIDQDFVYSGNTTRINELEYRIDTNNDGSIDDKLEYKYYYDSLGNIEKEYLYVNGIIQTYHNYDYDEMNQLILEDFRDYAGSCDMANDTCYTKTFEYDLHGNITDVKLYPFEENAGRPLEYEKVNSWYLGTFCSGCGYYSSYARIEIEHPNKILSTNSHVQVIIRGTSGFGSYMNTTFTKIKISGREYTISINETGHDQSIFVPVSSLVWDSYHNGYKLDYQQLWWEGCNSGTSIYAPSDTYVGTVSSFNNYPSEHIKYNYSNDWLDQLVNYETITYNSNGTINTQLTSQTYTYDNQGNPTTITNFKYNDTVYDHATLQYDGRQLKSIYIFSNDPQSVPDITVSYTYNDQGYRTSKAVWTWASQETITTKYHLQGDKVLLETDGNYAIIYTYDYDGKLISFNYDSNKNDTTKGIEYYYIRNQQGDIAKIVDKDGAIVVEYTYDAWGKLLKTEGSLASTIGQYNPYRYRGYRYDKEIDMYYLNSRFYDANVGRFINADGLLGTMGSVSTHNMFTYTGNNPVNRIDESGYKWSWSKITIVVAASIGIVAGVALIASGAGAVGGGYLIAISAGALIGGIQNEQNGGSFEAGAGAGAVLGAFLGAAGAAGGAALVAADAAGGLVAVGYAGLGLAGSASIGFLGGAYSSAILQTLNGQTIDVDEVLTSGAIYSFMGMGAGIIGGYVALIGAEQLAGAGVYTALAGTVAIVGEAVIDVVSVIVEEVRDFFDSEEE